MCSGTCGRAVLVNTNVCSSVESRCGGGRVACACASVMQKEWVSRRAKVMDIVERMSEGMDKKPKVIIVRPLPYL